jgi:hypothetical protein
MSFSPELKITNTKHCGDCAVIKHQQRQVELHIPEQSGHPFRFNSDTHSGLFRTPIPAIALARIQTKAYRLLRIQAVLLPLLQLAPGKINPATLEEAAFFISLGLIQP